MVKIESLVAVVVLGDNRFADQFLRGQQGLSCSHDEPAYQAVQVVETFHVVDATLSIPWETRRRTETDLFRELVV